MSRPRDVGDASVKRDRRCDRQKPIQVIAQRCDVLEERGDSDHGILLVPRQGAVRETQRMEAGGSAKNIWQLV